MKPAKKKCVTAKSQGGKQTTAVIAWCAYLSSAKAERFTGLKKGAMHGGKRKFSGTGNLGGNPLSNRMTKKKNETSPF